MWHVVETKPNAELLAHRKIGEQGYPVFLPLYWKRVRRRPDGWKRVRAILFPRYLFADVAEGRRWTPIANTRGVLRLVPSAGGDVPARLDEGVVDYLMRSHEAHDGAMRLEELEDSPLLPKTRVRVIDGPFTGFYGSVIDSAEHRVRLLLDALGGVKVTMEPEALVAEV